jgi:hypothetical protein
MMNLMNSLEYTNSYIGVQSMIVEEAFGIVMSLVHGGFIHSTRRSEMIL